MVLSDGLYPYGPVMELCKKNKWRFMIVLQNKSLKSVRDEYAGLKNRSLKTAMYNNGAVGNNDFNG